MKFGSHSFHLAGPRSLSKPQTFAGLEKKGCLGMDAGICMYANSGNRSGVSFRAISGEGQMVLYTPRVYIHRLLCGMA